MINYISLFICLIISQSAFASKYNYKVLKKDGHTIHIVTLSPNDFDTQFVKAHDQVFGRETVDSMATRSNADIAINGGFFEIGNNDDGMTSGTLIIDGKIFGLRSKEHACLEKRDGKLSIQTNSNIIKAEIGNDSININHVNQFAHNNDVVLYTDTWGPTTLTSFKSRKEIALDDHNKIIGIYEHGNNAIPKNGFVISLPGPYKLASSSSNNTITINGDNLLQNKEKVSLLMGIPQIVKQGKLTPNVLQSKSDFYTLPHSRTALGLKSDGGIVIAVVEQVYKKNLKDITLGEVKSLIQNNKLKLSKKYKKHPNNITLDELKEIVKEEFSSPNASIGLTLAELGNLMIDHGCDSAINLDGGGSSTLWIDGKVVNKTIGDKDESAGESVMRPVSDAIIFKKK